MNDNHKIKTENLYCNHFRRQRKHIVPSQLRVLPFARSEREGICIWGVIQHVTRHSNRGQVGLISVIHFHQM